MKSVVQTELSPPTTTPPTRVTYKCTPVGYQNIIEVVYELRPEAMCFFLLIILNLFTCVYYQDMSLGFRKCRAFNSETQLEKILAFCCRGK